MKDTPWIVAGLVSALGLLASASLLWPAPSTGKPFHGSSQPLNEQSCGDCHEGSVPLYHSEAFKAQDHGQAARVARTTCLSCHNEKTSCQACHTKAPPTWHSEAFLHPGRGPDERDAHVRLAASRKAGCMECHAQSFHSQCAECHQPREWPELKGAEGRGRAPW